VQLTDFTVKVSRNARQKTLTREWAASGVLAAWKATSWAKKIAAKKAKAGLTDFGRFQAKVAKQAVAAKVRKTLGVA